MYKDESIFYNDLERLYFRIAQGKYEDKDGETDNANIYFVINVIHGK